MYLITLFPRHFFLLAFKITFKWDFFHSPGLASCMRAAVIFFCIKIRFKIHPRTAFSFCTLYFLFFLLATLFFIVLNISHLLYRAFSIFRPRLASLQVMSLFFRPIKAKDYHFLAFWQKFVELVWIFEGYLLRKKNVFYFACLQFWERLIDLLLSWFFLSNISILFGIILKSNLLSWSGPCYYNNYSLNHLCSHHSSLRIFLLFLHASLLHNYFSEVKKTFLYPLNKFCLRRINLLKNY